MRLRPRIFLEEKIKTRSYDNKNGGKKYFTEITTSFLKIIRNIAVIKILQNRHIQ
jgi:hypothetical protein